MANNSALKMLLSILAILSVLQQAYPLETTEQDISTPDEYILKELGEHSHYLESKIDNLALQMDTTNTVNKQDLPSNCAEALHWSGFESGIHKIRIPESEMKPFFVYCMADPDIGGAVWTIIQRRMDGKIDFYRDWVEYQQGFGNMEREFFLGLDKINALTQSTLHELWIKMEDFENVTRSAYYSSFAIGDASEAYALNILGSFSGDAGDSLKFHAGHKFTTRDVDNDINDDDNCAVKFTGAWWYHNCHGSNLNGQYLGAEYVEENYGKGIVWNKWQSHKYVHMAIRSVSTSELF